MPTNYPKVTGDEKGPPVDAACQRVAPQLRQLKGDNQGTFSKHPRFDTTTSSESLGAGTPNDMMPVNKPPDEPLSANNGTVLAPSDDCSEILSCILKYQGRPHSNDNYI